MATQHKTPSYDELKAFWTYLQETNPIIYQHWNDNQPKKMVDDCPVCFDQVEVKAGNTTCQNGHMAACAKCTATIINRPTPDLRCTVCRDPNTFKPRPPPQRPQQAQPQQQRPQPNPRNPRPPQPRNPQHPRFPIPLPTHEQFMNTITMVSRTRTTGIPIRFRYDAGYGSERQENPLSGEMKIIDITPTYATYHDSTNNKTLKKRIIHLQSETRLTCPRSHFGHGVIEMTYRESL